MNPPVAVVLDGVISLIHTPLVFSVVVVSPPAGFSTRQIVFHVIQKRDHIFYNGKGVRHDSVMIEVDVILVEEGFKKFLVRVVIRFKTSDFAVKDSPGTREEVFELLFHDLDCINSASGGIDPGTSALCGQPYADYRYSRAR